MSVREGGRARAREMGREKKERGRFVSKGGYKRRGREKEREREVQNLKRHMLKHVMKHV